MSENVGLQALGKLEDTIVKILEAILKILDYRRQKFTDQINQLKGKNKKLKKKVEGLKKKLSNQEKDGADDITISQLDGAKSQLSKNEAKLSNLTNQLDQINNFQDAFNKAIEPDNVRTMAKAVFEKVQKGQGKVDMQQAVYDVVTNTLPKYNAARLEDIIKSVQVKANEIYEESQPLSFDKIVKSNGVGIFDKSSLREFICRYDAESRRTCETLSNKGKDSLSNLDKAKLMVHEAFQSKKGVLVDKQLYQLNTNGRAVLVQPGNEQSK